MRSLLTRGVRPSCLHHASTSASLNSIRRTILPPTRKSLTAADAFTILLPSVLTAAFVFDVTSKKERCREWDRQIALVEQEAEALRQTQLEKWSRIQQRSVIKGAALHRRWMSTAAVATMQENEELDPLEHEQELNSADSPIPGSLKGLVGTEQEQNAQARFERLIATRLALQLLAQIRANRTNLYSPKVNISPTDLGYDMSLDYLINELEKISRLISDMKPQNMPWAVKLSAKDQERKMELANRLNAMTDDFKQGLTHLPDYIMKYTKLVAEYKIGPSTEAYVRMMRAFSGWSRNSAMSAMVETALWDGHQVLDSYTLANVLHRHGSDGDALRLVKFLSIVSRKDGYPKTWHPWIRTQVDDVRIVVPVSRSKWLMTSLIRATLCNRQQSFAEAYGVIFVDRHNHDPEAGVYKWFVIGCYLQSYAEWGSWRSGRRWLQTAVNWAQDLYTSGSHVLGRVILRMLDFCVACDRQEEYELIMAATIAADLVVPPIQTDRPTRVTPRMGQIRLDWIARAKDADRMSDNRGKRSENVGEFQRQLHGRFIDDRPTIGSPYFSPFASRGQDQTTGNIFSTSPVVKEAGEAGDADNFASPFFNSPEYDPLADSLDDGERFISQASTTTQSQQMAPSEFQNINRRSFSSLARVRRGYVSYPTELVKEFHNGTHWVSAKHYTEALNKIAELEGVLEHIGVDVEKSGASAAEDVLAAWQNH